MSQTGSLMGFVHRRRRGAELFLLVLALAVGIGAYAAVGLGVEGAVPTDLVGYGGWLTALIVAAHVTVRVVAPYADPVLLPLVAALNGLGPRRHPPSRPHLRGARRRPSTPSPASS